MEYITIGKAIALAVRGSEETPDEAEGVKPPAPSPTVQPSVQPPLTEPSLTMESIFTLPPPESAYHLSTPSTRKQEKRYASFSDLHTVLDATTRVTKRSSRSLWKANAQLRARVSHELSMARIALRLATTYIIPFRGIPYGPTTSVQEGGTNDKSGTTFPGNVYIQEPIAAVSFALDEYETCRVDAANRLTFWVDASVRKGKDRVVGIAVVHKGSRNSKDWIPQGYSMHENLPINHAECLAIAQALHNALYLMDELPKPGSAVVVYSDSQYALGRILNFDVRNRGFGYAIVEMIMNKARELRRRGMRVFLHWVPSHQHVPGNELADWVARLASKGE